MLRALLVSWLVQMQREQRQAEDMSIQILSAGPCKYDMILHWQTELFNIG